jgi:hypothetical protein
MKARREKLRCAGERSSYGRLNDRRRRLLNTIP